MVCVSFCVGGGDGIGPGIARVFKISPMGTSVFCLCASLEWFDAETEDWDDFVEDWKAVNVSRYATLSIKLNSLTVITKSIVLKFFRQLKQRAKFVFGLMPVLNSLQTGHRNL
jgi:hypothetical protein